MVLFGARGRGQFCTFYFWIKTDSDRPNLYCRLFSNFLASLGPNLDSSPKFHRKTLVVKMMPVGGFVAVRASTFRFRSITATVRNILMAVGRIIEQ